MTNSIFEFTNRSQHGKDNYRIQSRLEANKKRYCSCDDCLNMRDNLSIYCRYHRDRYRRHGHPTLKAPNQSQLKALEDVIKDWLENDNLLTTFEKESFKKSWGTSVIQLRKSPKYAMPFFTLEGMSGYTAQTKAFILLSWYYHKQGKPIGAAMLRYMAIRLWSQLNFKMGQGKKNYAKELHYFVNTLAGKFVIHHAGFSKEKSDYKIVGWDEPSFLSSIEKHKSSKPITERTVKRVGLPNNKAAGIARAIGAEIRLSVEHAMGNQWFNNSNLLAKAIKALAS